MCRNAHSATTMDLPTRSVTGRHTKEHHRSGTRNTPHALCAIDSLRVGRRASITAGKPPCSRLLRSFRPELPSKTRPDIVCTRPRCSSSRADNAPSSIRIAGGHSETAVWSEFGSMRTNVRHIPQRQKCHIRRGPQGDLIDFIRSMAATLRSRDPFSREAARTVASWSRWSSATTVCAETDTAELRPMHIHGFRLELYINAFQQACS
jgi:hypothetical protein